MNLATARDEECNRKIGVCGHNPTKAGPSLRSGRQCWGKADSRNATYSRAYCVSRSTSAESSGVAVKAVFPYSHPLSKAFKFSSLKLGGTEDAMAWRTASGSSK